MKLMGIDYGTKRVGVALSDDDGSMAFPYKVVENDQDLLSRIKKIIADEKVEAVVLGHSTNYKWEDNPVMKKVKEFKSKLEDISDISIYFEPEFLTSVQARRQPSTPGRMLDASAAALILQSFIDTKAQEKNDE